MSAAMPGARRPRSVRPIRDAGDLDVVPAADEVDLRHGLVTDLLRGRRLVEPLEELVGRSGTRPYGEEIAQPCLIGGIRVAIERDVDPRRCSDGGCGGGCAAAVRT